jgi:hypothetical protein
MQVTSFFEGQKLDKVIQLEFIDNDQLREKYAARLRSDFDNYFNYDNTSDFLILLYLKVSEAHTGT